MTTETTTKPPAQTAAAAATRPRRPVERHLGDAIRVLLGTTAVAISAIVAHYTRLPRLEADLFHLINDLPTWVEPALWPIMQLGTIGAVGVAALAALVFRRFGLARDVAVAGTLAYLLALVVKDVVGRARPDVLLPDLVLRSEQGGLGFVSGHAAVAAALAAAAGPWLPRPWRRTVWAAAAIVGLARVFMGAHLVLDVFGGAALGWTVAAALHLLWGAPVHRAEAPDLWRALAVVGFRPAGVVPVQEDARGSRPFIVTTEAGPDLFVKIIGYHERNADLLFKMFRHAVFREVEDESPFATPKQQAEHEAFVALLARRAGVRTPEIVGVGVTDRGDAWFAEACVSAQNLARTTEAISDDTLCDVWGQLALLRDARIAHRDLRLANVLVDADGHAWIVDFGFGESSATRHRLDADVAELLVSMSLAVGTRRAVATALRVLGRDALLGAAPQLQPLALAAATRSAARRQHGLLGELRTVLADATGAELPPPEVMVRVRWQTLGWIAATLFATYILLPQIDQLGATVTVLDDAQWAWLAGTFVMAVATYLTAALALMGASPRPLAFGRTVNVQLASSFANRLAPFGIGSTAVNERYLERSGLSRTTAVAAIALIVSSGFILHFVELIGAGLWLGQTRLLLTSALPSGWGLLIGFVAVMTVLGAAVWMLFKRPDWLKQLRGTARSIAAITRSPRQAALLFGGQLGTNLCYVAALGFSVHAFGGSPAPALLAAVYLGGAALGAASPTPAGLGVVEASLVAGLTVGGVPGPSAIAGVLAYRLATFWLPAAVGFFSFRYLQRHRIL
ncbi:lysylphosphatidylglycerol synthase domain-containing protein [Nocardia mexicana]|uniref:Undecaprenyl-diphosphatase n=1 Tax=Nocardia mexicana TaxID=279262 RepID=A0A370HDB3_9NOCA|nr:lysylphosphatidylglycerol synthase domain-containing protein [Nocardia mexicana]RDI55217.1 undecaprenyl-diphosphatase [Nocardia mexicana]